VPIYTAQRKYSVKLICALYRLDVGLVWEKIKSSHLGQLVYSLAIQMP
jgi:hypothetical protein